MKIRFTKWLMLVAVLMASLCTQAQELAVVVVKPDGTQSEHRIADIDRIVVGDTSATIQHADGKSAEHAFTDIDKILIGTPWSAVKDLLAGGNIAVWPTRTNATVNVAGAKAGQAVAVYDLSGTAIASTTTDADGCATINISSAAKGVYIIATKGLSVKIVKY